MSKWIVFMAVLTGLGIGWLHVTDVDPTRDFSPAIVVIAYSPTVAALAVAIRSRSVGALIEPVTKVRVDTVWYLAALAGPFGIALVAKAMTAISGVPPAGWIEVPSEGALLAMLGPLAAGTLGEEFGWRGFAQRRLQKRHTALIASLLVGVVWATWHQWSLLAPGGTVGPLDVFASYVRLGSTAVIYGWLYNSTGSLLVVMVAHAAHNLAVEIIPVGSDFHSQFHLALALVYLATAVGVAATTNSASLTRRQPR